MLNDEHAHTHVFLLREDLLPRCDLAKHQQDLRFVGQGSTAWVEPDESLSGFVAERHHVVVGGHDHLVRSLRERYELCVGAAL